MFPQTTKPFLASLNRPKGETSLVPVNLPFFLHLLDEFRQSRQIETQPWLVDGWCATQHFRNQWPMAKVAKFRRKPLYKAQLWRTQTTRKLGSVGRSRILSDCSKH